MEARDINIPSDISAVLEEVERQSQPVSIFIYGSRARLDYKEHSDYEVGVLFERDKKWGRSQLATLHSNPGLNIYPFVLEDFQQYKLDTPFPKAVYLRELMTGAVTVRGQKIIEGMELPEVKLSDLAEVVIFQTAYALGAVLSARQKDLVTASIEFTKSALFGARALVVLGFGSFPLSYNEIYKEASKLDFLDDDAKAILCHAMEVRHGQPIDTTLLYKNITFLNQTIYPRIKSQLMDGDRVVLGGHTISY